MTVKNIHGQQAIDSREVAEMVERNHKELLRDIRKYIEIMEKANERNFAPVDFFIESSYKDSKGETRPCYLITKKGCDMIANKLTGEKGVLFTAAYVTAFEEMQRAMQFQYQPPAFYPTKATSLGEVASYMKEMRIEMEKAGHRSQTILQQSELTCRHFGLPTLPNLGVPPLPTQLSFSDMRTLQSEGEKQLPEGGAL